MKSKRCQAGRLLGLAVFLLILGSISVRLTIAYLQPPQPQVILVLGGDPQREVAAAQLARYYPKLEIWVSSGALPKQSTATFAAAQVSTKRLHLDYRATDTVTNFTTLIPEFQEHHIQHLFLVTSDFHMPRAEAIAVLVLGSQGIAFTPVAVPTHQPPESKLRIARDMGRSLLWIATGKTGATWGERWVSRRSEAMNP